MWFPHRSAHCVHAPIDVRIPGLKWISSDCRLMPRDSVPGVEGERMVRLRCWSVIGCLLSLACESAQTRDQLSRQARAIDSLELSLGEVRRQREARELIEDKLIDLLEKQSEQSSAIDQLKVDLTTLSSATDDDAKERAHVVRAAAELRRRVEVLEAGQDDIVAGLKSLARNREQLQSLDARMSELEQRLEAMRAEQRDAQTKDESGN